MLGIFSFIFILGIIGLVYAENVICYSNSDCVSGFVGENFCSNNDVYKNFLNSSCINPGTNTSYCSNTTVPILLPSGDCGNSEYSNWSDNHCINNSVYHSRTGTERGCRIINPLTNISGCFFEFVFVEVLVQSCSNGCNNGICNNISIACYNNADCGCNGFFGNTTCSNNNVFGNFIVYTCNNPGTANSSCSNEINFQLKWDCGDNSCGSYGTNYCINNSVYHNRTCNDRGCNLGVCFNNSRNDESLVQNCNSGCSNEECLNVICNSDSQCGSNGFTMNKYCKNHDVHADYKEYKCLNPGTVNSSCSVNTNSRLFEKCDYKCRNGECDGRNPDDYPTNCDSFDCKPITQTKSTGFDVYIQNKTTDDIVKINTTIISGNENSSMSFLGRNLFIILMILIVVLIVLIIILTLMR